jgi:hypothetical protein
MDLAQFTASVRGPRVQSRKSAIEAIYATAHWLLGRERVADAAKVFRTMIRAAPGDERGWLGLGECHERIHQPRIAAELYGAGSLAASVKRVGDGAGIVPSVRCLLARARVLAANDRAEDALGALEAAAQAAADQDDDELATLVAKERRRLS